MRQRSLGITSAGGATIAGGVLLAAVAALVATRPVGTAGLHHRADDLWPVASVAPVLVAAGAVGLLQGQRRPGTPGVIGLWVMATGALLAAGMQLVAAGGTGVPWTATVAALLGVLAGSALIAVAGLRAGAVPRPAAAMLLGASVLALFSNTEDARAWLAAPFGLAWAWVGLVTTGRPGHR